MTVRRQEWMTDQVYAWACLEREARLNTLARRNTNKDVLVAIKAQHPLHEDGTPGPEYELRLEKALEVGARLESKGWKVTYMTFGGIHEGNKYVTLADAGAAWLKSHGVVSVITCPVVFSGNDEDRMAAEEFANGAHNYSQLHVILSAGQWDRTRLYFIFMGWQPEMHPVIYLDDDPNHSSVCELWGGWAVPAFAEGPDAIAKATEEIRNKHLEGAMK